MASTLRIEGVKEFYTYETAHFDLETNVTAELKSLVDESISKATVQFKSESAPGIFTYEIAYTPTIRGRHELTVKVNGVDVSGSPFKVFVRHPPTQLGKPFKVLNGLNNAVGVTVGQNKTVYVARDISYTVSVFDKRPVWIRSIGKYGMPPFGGNGPYGIATDDDGYIYVATNFGHLLKVDMDGEIIKSLVVEKGNSLRGIKMHKGRLFVCDVKNHKVHIFDTELNSLSSFYVMDITGEGYNRPMDLSFDAQGKIYICDYRSVQVVDANGQYLNHFSKKEDGAENGDGAEKITDPRGIHVFGDHVYISEYSDHCISVFSTDGDFITSFGKQGEERGELEKPRGITVDVDGFVYICDNGNERVQVF